MILVNSLLVGFEVQMSLDGLDVTWMQPLDTGFIGLYFLELCMRLVGMGWRQCFCDGWFLLDFTLAAWLQSLVQCKALIAKFLGASTVSRVVLVKGLFKGSAKAHGTPMEKT